MFKNFKEIINIKLTWKKKCHLLQHSITTVMFWSATFCTECCYTSMFWYIQLLLLCFVTFCYCCYVLKCHLPHRMLLLPRSEVPPSTPHYCYVLWHSVTTAVLWNATFFLFWTLLCHVLQHSVTSAVFCNILSLLP